MADSPGTPLEKLLARRDQYERLGKEFDPDTQIADVKNLFRLEKKWGPEHPLIKQLDAVSITPLAPSPERAEAVSATDAEVVQAEAESAKRVSDAVMEEASKTDDPTELRALLAKQQEALGNYQPPVAEEPSFEPSIIPAGEPAPEPVALPPSADVPSWEAFHKMKMNDIRAWADERGIPIPANLRGVTTKAALVEHVLEQVSPVGV